MDLPNGGFGAVANGKQPKKPIGVMVIKPALRRQAARQAVQFGAPGSALAVGVAANAGPLIAIGGQHKVVKKKPPAKARNHSQAGAVTSDDSVNPTLTAAPSNFPSGSDYASGQSGGAAAGFGSNYGGTDDSGADPYATAPPDMSTPASSAASSSIIGPKTKIWLLVGGGIVLVVFGYGYLKYRQYTWPIRKYRQIRAAAKGLIGAAKG